MSNVGLRPRTTHSHVCNVPLDAQAGHLVLTAKDAAQCVEVFLHALGCIDED